MDKLLAAPPIASSTQVEDLRLLAVDVETTGLDPARDHVVSVGWVPVDGGSIVLGRARRVVVRMDEQTHQVGQSAVFHGLTDDVVAAGVPRAEALAEVAEALTGRVLLAHHAPIELGFFRHASRRLHGVRPTITAVDTLDLQQRILARESRAPEGGELRLWAARAHFGLPVVPAHDALSDALACAELYLAQIAELGTRGPLRLDDLRYRP